MQVTQTPLEGVLIIEPRVFGDDRGFFLESYHSRRYAEYGITADFTQDNRSRSRGGVLRGLHYQLRNPQAKLVSVTQGEVFDVAVDVRKGSPTFGQWFGLVLSDANHLQLYIPAGFAHGFYVMSEWADFSYKCSNFYTPGDEYGIAWDDPSLGIQWQLSQNSIPTLSEKDRIHPLLQDVSPELLPQYVKKLGEKVE